MGSRYGLQKTSLPLLFPSTWVLFSLLIG
jgi:hypothetical protein